MKAGGQMRWCQVGTRARYWTCGRQHLTTARHACRKSRRAITSTKSGSTSTVGGAAGGRAGGLQRQCRAPCAAPPSQTHCRCCRALCRASFAYIHPAAAAARAHAHATINAVDTVHAGATCFFAYLYVRPLIRKRLGSASRWGLLPPPTAAHPAATRMQRIAWPARHPPSAHNALLPSPACRVLRRRRGYINWGSVYIAWLLSAISYHLPTLESMGGCCWAVLSTEGLRGAAAQLRSLLWGWAVRW